MSLWQNRYIVEDMSILVALNLLGLLGALIKESKISLQTNQKKMGSL